MSSNADNFPRTLRGFASISSIIAGSLMLSAHDTTTSMETVREVSYADITPYLCFVIANFAIGGYNALLVWLPATSQLWRLVVALDAILVVALSSSCSAALPIALMESRGNSHACWFPICHTFPTYCNLVFMAIGFGYGGAIIYLMLHLLIIQKELNSILVG